ncbi:MAG: choice-of-anchor K domain-containing protein, partial [Pseudomonadota bacterium]
MPDQQYSNGSHTQVEWGYASRSSGSTLTADDVTWNVGTPANNVVIAELTWFNRSTSADVTPDNYGVHYNLTITFTAPGIVERYRDVRSIDHQHEQSDRRSDGGPH